MENKMINESSTSSDLELLEPFLQILTKNQKPARVKALTDILRSILRLAKDSPGTLNLKITATVLRELRYSFKIFYPFRFTPKLTIFGSARVLPNTPLYDFAKQFSQEAVKRKFLVMTGGGPGIMAAGNEGADGEGGFGLNIKLPVEQSANPFIDAEKRLIHYKYFFTRKLFLVKEAWAFAFFPGGFGTLDEAFEVLTLMQTGKSNLIPVVMMEPKGSRFWRNFTDFIKKGLLSGGYVSDSDKHLFHVFHTPKEALDHIEQFYKNYHSMRLVKEKLVIRIKKAISPIALKKINKDFKDLSSGQPVHLSGPLTEEENEPEFKNLPRLVFPFDHRDYGRLRLLVNYLNTAPCK